MGLESVKLGFQAAKMGIYDDFITTMAPNGYDHQLERTLCLVMDKKSNLDAEPGVVSSLELVLGKN